MNLKYSILKFQLKNSITITLNINNSLTLNITCIKILLYIIKENTSNILRPSSISRGLGGRGASSVLGSGARIEGEGVEEEQTGIVGAGSSKSTAGAVDDDGGA